VYSYTAPAAGKYTFRTTARIVGSTIYTQDVVLYLTDCANSGTVNCLKGGNARYSQVNPGSLGQSHGISESVDCYPMAAGETTYLVLDDGVPGKCSNNQHTCVDDSYCAAGATCVPQINAGGPFTVEVISCDEEVEPNDTPATASALSCGVTGATGVAPIAHCYLGSRAGNVCTRPYVSAIFLDQTNPDSNMRCAVGGAMCVVDVATGIGDCAPGTGPCQQQTDLDCDPRCDIGPNAGKTCSTAAFCNPVSDQGSTCAGGCVAERTCIVTATGADTGVPCNPTCQGSTIAAINGRSCIGAANFNACPGGGTCTTTALAPLPGAQCATGERCGVEFNEGDTDYYSVGSPVAGSKVFAMVWANNSNDFDYRMRVTNATNTLQMDDNDGVSYFGASVAPVIGGAVTDGSPTYLQVGRSIPRTTKTYQVYSIVRPPLAAAQLEDESGPFGNNLTFYWPGDVIAANPITAGGYVRGSMNGPNDSDCFKFLFNKGDLIDFFGDGGPARGTGSVATISNAFPIMYYAEDGGVTNFIFGTEVKKNLAANVQGPGLRALSPAVTSQYVQWRANYTGMMEVCYYDLSTAYSTAGPQTFPAAWAGSISINCAPIANSGPGTTTAEVSITKSGPVGPVATGSFFDYTVTVTNSGTEIAQEIEVFDQLDANLTYVGLDVDDTLGGNNVACFSLPSIGTNDAPIDCINASMAPGSSTVYTIHVQVNNCIGDGVVINNTADIISTSSTDPNPGNNSASADPVTTVAAADDGCTDINCDEDTQTCWPEACTSNDHCDAGICVNEPTNCDDSSVCTDDLCDSQDGCIYDPTPGQLCDDFNDCTVNTCDPIAYCVYPAEPPTKPCDDNVACTSPDFCDGAGVCVGTSVCDDGSVCTTDTCDFALGCVYTPIICDDSSACTTDSCDPATGCVYTPVTCDDSSACTTDSCDPATGCVYTPVTCDDSSACTTDSCDPATGCVYTPVTCDDSSACTTDSCDPASGCVYTPVTCDDSSACTTDSCDPATGCVYTPVTCDDSSACTTDSCDPATGCVTTPVTCNDGSACTTDSCNPATGCVTTPVTCNDGNACTTDSCNPATGCVTTPVTCDDLDACNGVESCNPASGCVDGTPVVCAASDQCHAVGSCDTVTGACSNPVKPGGTACDDGDFCTTIDACNAAGNCVGGVALDCPSDAAVCTAEVCDPTIGCVHSDINLDVSNFSDTRVDGLDLAVLAAAWNSCPVDVVRYNAGANLDRLATPPGVCIGATDFHLFMNAFGRSCQ
jgi:uncharacterized repeat protein (TIGR01451 family)